MSMSKYLLFTVANKLNDTSQNQLLKHFCCFDSAQEYLDSSL